MEWEFTPEQVVKGEVDYGLDDFRGHLREETAFNLSHLDREQIAKIFDLYYDLCYWLATGKDFAEFEAQFEEGAYVRLFLNQLRQHSEANVEMLGAILQRHIMDGVEKGLSVEGAAHRTSDYHQQVVGNDVRLATHAAAT